MDRCHQALYDTESVVHDFGKGARQPVVQEALETTVISFLYPSWLTPMTNIGAFFDVQLRQKLLPPPEVGRPLIMH